MIRLIRWILDDYIRTQRIFVEWGAALVIAYVALANHVDPTSTLSTWALSSFALALYTTSVIADMADHPISLTRLLQLPSRVHYMSAYLVSAFLIVLSAYALLVGATAVLAPAAFPVWTVWLASLPPLLVLIATGIVVMILLTPLVASSVQRIFLLAMLAVPLTWDRVIALLPDMLPATAMALFHAFTTVFGVVLWPSMQLYALTSAPEYTLVTVLLVTIHIGILVCLTALTLRWYARRPLTIA